MYPQPTRVPQAVFSPVEAVLLHAESFADWARESGGNNRGQVVEHWLRTVGFRPGDPWCVAFVWTMGHDILGERWPVPRTASVDVVLEWARRKGVLHKSPAIGDLGIVMRHEHDGTHIFFVTDVVRQRGELVVRTIEGNTNDGRSREGDRVMRHTRVVRPGKYTFVRWSEAL